MSSLFDFLEKGKSLAFVLLWMMVCVPLGGADHLAYVKGELFMEEARQLVKEYLPERYFVVDAVTLCHQRLTDKGRIFAVET